MAQTIPLLLTPLEGKKVEKNRIPCTLVGLSGKGGLVQMPNPLESMINVKMNLQEAPKKLTSRDFYGKVMDFQKGEEFLHRIRFTAVPGEVDAYFQALMQYGTKPIEK